MLKPSLFLIICFASLILPSVSHAQTPTWQPQANTRAGYTIRYSTDSNFEAVPLHAKLRYVFAGHAYYQEHSVLNPMDLEIIYAAHTLKPAFQRTFDVWQEGCDWYIQQLDIGAELDFDYLNQVLVTGAKYELEDMELHYSTAYDLLSDQGKDFILQKMADMEGTGVLAGGRFDSESFGRDYPEEIIPRFDRMCNLLPQIIEMYSSSPTTSVENSTPIPINQ